MSRLGMRFGRLVLGLSMVALVAIGPAEPRAAPADYPTEALAAHLVLLFDPKTFETLLAATQ